MPGVLADGFASPNPMSESTSSGQITHLLARWRAGDDEAFARLLPLVYHELRSLAGVYLAKERPSHTLQPTALVHEAWLRLIRQGPVNADCRRHFLAAAAQGMRRILVEHARRHRAGKRGGETPVLPLDGAGHPAPDRHPDVLDVHRALEDLEIVDARQAKLVELRYFGGMTLPEAAETIGVSAATAARDWTVARLWLRRRLAALGGDGAEAR